MKRLDIEWLHYEKDGTTCIRCSSTGKTLMEVVSELREEMAPKGVPVTFTETTLGLEEIPRSNVVLFNGVSLEDLLAGVEVSENECTSCSCLTGAETLCRTIEYEGRIYEAIPEELIRKAAKEALRVSDL